MARYQETRIPVRGSDGSRTVIIERVKMINTSSLDGPGSSPGLPEYFVENGGHVNLDDDSGWESLDRSVSYQRE